MNECQLLNLPRRNCMKVFTYVLIGLCIFVCGVQLGIRHGRELEAADHRLYVASAVTGKDAPPADSEEYCGQQLQNGHMVAAPCEANDQ